MESENNTTQSILENRNDSLGMKHNPTVTKGKEKWGKEKKQFHLKYIRIKYLGANLTRS